MTVNSLRKFYITTLGCKLNFAESSALTNTLSNNGWQHTQTASEADLIIVHSCAVTAMAEKKTRQVLSKLLKTAPEAQIAVIGCMADVNSNPLEAMLKNRKHFIYKHDQKMDLPDLISGDIVSNDTINPFRSGFSIEQRTRSFLKIQDGCDYFCTYCTIPYARGRSTSNTISGVMTDITKIVSNGFREIILTGVNIGTFGLHHNESFLKLLKTIDKECKEIRVRLGSTEPDLLQNEIIDLVSNSAILMPHFHLPLQSGCNTTLQRMHRHYTTNLFQQKIDYIKKQIPTACIAIDVITGFPGETENEFEQTIHFIKSLPISYLHVFPYSDRPLAKASKYPDHVDPHTIRQRVAKLLELGQEKQQIFFQQNLETIRPVLAEGTRKNGLRYGFTDNYIKCAANEKLINENELYTLQLKEIDENKEFVRCEFPKKIKN